MIILPRLALLAVVFIYLSEGVWWSIPIGAVLVWNFWDAIYHTRVGP